MWKRNTALFLFVTLTSVAFSPGCATITRRRTQRIPVTSSPTGATVSVNGQQQGVTPLEISLARKAKGQVIRIESPGYDPVEIRPKWKMSGGPIIGNFLLGVPLAFVPALAWKLNNDESPHSVETLFFIWTLGTLALGGGFTLIDSGTKGFEFAPKELAVTLTKAEGPPRVKVLLIDVSDFQNIKWIRVRKD
jgi:hypothetical protein